MSDATPPTLVRPLAPGFAGPEALGQSAVVLARRIREGDLTSAELVETYLARITEHNPRLQAFTQLFTAQARREAERADRLRARGKLLGPFHGVPTGVKDQHLVAATTTRFGTRALPPVWSPIDDPIVRRLRRAGFIVLGKTAMSELGILPITEPDLHPPTRSPWDPNRSAGGSSGGAGAAIAAGLLPIAPGSDGAGSVRIPAAINGVWGHKPTRGLVRDTLDHLERFGLVTVGPLARCVDDAAALLDVLAGPAGAHHATGSRLPLRPLRIGVVREPPFGELDPRLVAAVDRAADHLRAAGHRLEARPCPRGTVAEFLPLYQRMLARVPVMFPGRQQDLTRWFRDQGRAVPDAVAWERVRSYEARAAEAMDGLDALLTPALGMFTPRVGAFRHLPPPALFDAVAPLGAFTALCNVSGQPALVAPCGEADGLPVAVQLVGRHGHDEQLLALGRELEASA
jgi:amidase